MQGHGGLSIMTRDMTRTVNDTGSEHQRYSASKQLIVELVFRKAANELTRQKRLIDWNNLI